MRGIALVVLAVGVGACGDSKDKTVDAAVDGAPDSAPAPVTVTVHKDGGPQSGVRVLFQNADSSVVLAGTTDASGVASTTMAAGGFVTVIDPAGPPGGSSTHKLTTTSDVQPGDHITVDATTHVQFVVHVTVPYVLDVSVQQYSVATACGVGYVDQPGTATNPTADVLLTDCPATTDVLIRALDSAGGTVRFAFAPNTAVSSQATIDLTAATLSSPSPRTYQLNNYRVDADTPFIEDGPANARGAIEIFSPASYTGTGTSTVTANKSLPHTSGSYLTLVGMQNATTYPNDTYHFLEGAAWTDSYTTDVSARMIGWVNGPPGYDAAGHLASWVEVAAGGTPDVVHLELDAMRSALAWKWEIVGPHTSSTISVPVLPMDTNDFNIAASELTKVQLALVKIAGGYAGVRQGLFSTNLYGGVSGQITVLNVGMGL